MKPKSSLNNAKKRSQKWTIRGQNSKSTVFFLISTQFISNKFEADIQWRYPNRGVTLCLFNFEQSFLLFAQKNWK